MKQGEGGEDDLRLKGWVAWGSEGIAQREIHEQGARRSDAFRDLAEERDGDGWDPGFLDDALDQSDGLMAQPSRRRQQHGIDLLAAQEVSDLRRVLLL